MTSPRQRRLKTLLLLALIAILTTLYLTTSSSSTRSSDFYTRTSAALVEKHEAAAAAAKARETETGKVPLEKDEGVQERLREAEVRAKKSAERKGMRVKQEVLGAERDVESTGAEEEVVAEGEEDEGVDVISKDRTSDKDATAGKSTQKEKGGKGVGGRYKLPEGQQEGDGVAKVGGNLEDKPLRGVDEHEESEEEHEVEQELNAILKRSPIIIFSKTFCPHSKRAKRILLTSYKIIPPPYVVELDEHPLGPALQAALAKTTNRRTVPNVLINGVSIGGGDEVQKLHDNGLMEETVLRMAGKRVTSIAPAGGRGGDM